MTGPNSPQPSDEAHLAAVRTYVEEMDFGVTQPDLAFMLRLLDAARAEIATLRWNLELAKECEDINRAEVARLCSAAPSDDLRAAFAVPEGWRIYRLWNNSLASQLDTSWMVEIQRGTENVYMRNVDGDVGHATPLEAIEAASARIRALASPQPDAGARGEGGHCKECPTFDDCSARGCLRERVRTAPSPSPEAAPPRTTGYHCKNLAGWCQVWCGTCRTYDDAAPPSGDAMEEAHEVLRDGHRQHLREMPGGKTLTLCEVDAIAAALTRRDRVAAEKMNNSFEYNHCGFCGSVCWPGNRCHNCNSYDKAKHTKYANTIELVGTQYYPKEYLSRIRPPDASP